MKNNKTLGPDGLLNEYYAASIDVLADNMCEVYNKFFESKVLPKSMTGAVTILLHGSGNRSDPRNERPIMI